MEQLTGESLKKFIQYKLKNNDITEMIEGENYYRGKQQIDNKKRLARDQKGRIVELKGLPNAIVKDNQYSKLVDQKINYSFFNIPTVSCQESEEYQERLQDFFTKRFMRLLRRVEKDAMNKKIGWLYVYTDGQELYFKRIDAKDVIPLWTDNTHESLDAVILQRTASTWDSEKEEMKDRYFIEYYTINGIEIFEKIKDKLEHIESKAYLSGKDGQGYTWGRLPFVFFRYSDEEITLLSRVKHLQDAINLILSVFSDNMLEDNRNTVLIIKNYGGDNAEDIRTEINSTGIIQIEDDGDVDTLMIEVNAENYQTHLEILKEKLIENGRGFDLKTSRTSGDPNQLNIKSMYAEIDLDANAIESEFQASFEYLQYFFKKVHRIDEKLVADVEFKRRIMVNDESTVTMIKNSVGLVSERTLREKHPFVDSVDEEETRIAQERHGSLEAFSYEE